MTSLAPAGGAHELPERCKCLGQQVDAHVQVLTSRTCIDTGGKVLTYMDAATIVALIVGILAASAALLNSIVIYYLAYKQSKEGKVARQGDHLLNRWTTYTQGEQSSPAYALNWLRTNYLPNNTVWFPRFVGPATAWTEDEKKANLYRKILRNFWECTIQQYKSEQLPADFFDEERGPWLRWGVTYMEAVEVLDIANYHHKGLHWKKGSYSSMRIKLNQAYTCIDNLRQLQNARGQAGAQRPASFDKLHLPAVCRQYLANMDTQLQLQCGQLRGSHHLPAENK